MGPRGVPETGFDISIPKHVHVYGMIDAMMIVEHVVVLVMDMVLALRRAETGEPRQVGPKIIFVLDFSF